MGPWGRRFESCLPDHCLGALAQLGERLPCTQEVSGSIPLGSTNFLFAALDDASCVKTHVLIARLAKRKLAKYPRLSSLPHELIDKRCEHCLPITLCDVLFNNLDKLIKKQTKFEQARYNSPDYLVAYRSCHVHTVRNVEAKATLFWVVWLSD